MPGKPTISVLVPTRNRRALLETAIQDVLDQDLDEPIELLISDNASDDGTRTLLRSLDSHRLHEHNIALRSWFQERNIGIVANFNYLLSQASGEFCAFHLDDDRWSPQYLRHAVATLRNHPFCVAVLTANKEHDDFGKEMSGWLQTHIHPLTRRAPAGGIHSLADILPVFVSRPACNLSQVVFRQGGYSGDERDGAHFDAVFFLCLLTSGDLFVDPTERCSFRVSRDAYGRLDVLRHMDDDHIQYSHAMINALGKLSRSGRLARSALRDFALRRAAKSLAHFAKSVANGRPNPRFLWFVITFLMGLATGWPVRSLDRFSQR